MNPDHNAAEAYRRIKDQLPRQHADLADRLVRTAAAALINASTDRRYTQLPPPVLHATNELVRQVGPEALDLLPLELARDMDRRFERSGLTSVFWPEYERSINRIVARTLDDDARQIHLPDIENDVFLKDLAILSFMFVPCGSQVVSRHSGVPRRLLIRQSPALLARAAYFFGVKVGGFSPFIENHVHQGMVGDFSPEGRERYLRLVAKLLECWPESRGLTGSSWYYDPAVSLISPHLRYLRDVPTQHGALFLRGTQDKVAAHDATSTSATRRARFEEGSYRPTRYVLAWARADLVDAFG